MEKYYILENNNVVGPFSIDQLKEKQLQVNTLLCKEGTEDWMKLSDYPELNSLKQFLPPPAPPKEINIKANLANSINYIFSKTFLSKFFIIIGASLILGVVVGLIYFYSSGGGYHLKCYKVYQILGEKYHDPDFGWHPWSGGDLIPVVDEEGQTYYTEPIMRVRVPKLLEEMKMEIDPEDTGLLNKIGEDYWNYSGSLYEAEEDHKEKFMAIRSDSIKYGIITSLISLLIVIVYIIASKSVKWVKENATK